MIASIKGLKHAPSNFCIEILPQYLAANGTLVCYPGSVFEGLVKLTLLEPIVFQRLKVVFKATERVNYDAMGWEKIKNDDGRLFAVRTTILGRHMQHSGNNSTTLQPGEHVFSFAIELPLVNYPPSIDHHLVGTTFTLLASIERGTGVNGHIFRSAPYTVCFRPALQTRVNKVLAHSSTSSSSSEHIAQLTQRITAKLSLPSLEYNLFDTTKIPLKLTLNAASENYFADISLHQLHISLKQTITIVHKTFTRMETSTISHIDDRISTMTSPPTPPSSPPPPIASASSARSSSSSSSSSASSSSSSAARIVYQCDLAIDNNLLPTVDYSSRYKVDYVLSVSVKTRHGPLSTKKKLFNLPIHFGTLPAGMLPNEAIQVYTDEDVINSTSLLFKPKFLKPLNDPVEFLPAYDELYRPPSYRSMTAAAAAAAANASTTLSTPPPGPPPPRSARAIPFVPL